MGALSCINMWPAAGVPSGPFSTWFSSHLALLTSVCLLTMRCGSQKKSLKFSINSLLLLFWLLNRVEKSAIIKQIINLSLAHINAAFIEETFFKSEIRSQKSNPRQMSSFTFIITGHQTNCDYAANYGILISCFCNILTFYSFLHWATRRRRCVVGWMRPFVGRPCIPRVLMERDCGGAKRNDLISAKEKRLNQPRVRGRIEGK